MIKFLFGIIFALVIIPVLDGLTSLILTLIEVWKSYLATIITRNNQQIEQLSPPQRQIGFTISEGEEVEVDNDL